jgi:hypothetical protein
LDSADWQDRVYAEALENSLTGLETRRRVDPGFSIGDAEGTLRHLYIQEGNDWCGRGMLQDAILSATIAAHEMFIDAWRNEERATS